MGFGDVVEVDLHKVDEVVVAEEAWPRKTAL